MAADQIQAVEETLELQDVSDECLEAVGLLAGAYGPSQMNCPRTLTCDA
jgi:hypothetical protein